MGIYERRTLQAEGRANESEHGGFKKQKTSQHAWKGRSRKWGEEPGMREEAGIIHTGQQ